MFILSLTEVLIALASAVLFIVIGYQIYFLPQKYPSREMTYPIPSRVDKFFVFSPRWIWVYSALYYPFVISPIFTLQSLSHFHITCINYFLLLFLHVIISYQFPIKTPREWREYPKDTLSKKFLGFVQKIDKGGNGYPSMHVAVAVLTALHIVNNTYAEFGTTSLAIFLVPFFIAISTLYTKQHFVKDIFPAIPLAFAVFIVHFILF